MSTTWKIIVAILIVLLGLLGWSKWSGNGVDVSLPGTAQNESTGDVDEIVASLLRDAENEAALSESASAEDSAITTNDVDELNNVTNNYNDRGF